MGEKEKLAILLSLRKVREENNPLSFLVDALIQSLYSQDKQQKMCVYEFPGIRESKMPQPYTQLGDIYRNPETFRKQSRQLLPTTPNTHTQKPQNLLPKPHCQNCLWHGMICIAFWVLLVFCCFIFQIEKEPRTILAMVVLSRHSVQ